MQRFSYSYQGQIQEAFSEHFTENGYNRYLITLSNGSSLVITPAGIPGSSGIIWLQSTQREDIVYSHDLIQALGDGIEEERLF
jgi:hypothetical protein